MGFIVIWHPYRSDPTNGALISILGALTLAINEVFLKAINSTINPFVLQLFNLLASFVLAPLVDLILWDFKFPSFSEIILIILLGIFNFLGFIYLIKGSVIV